MRRTITMRSDLLDRMEMAADLISDKTLEDLIDVAAEGFLKGISEALLELNEDNSG